MSRKIALKRLTASDLTFFRWHFEHRPAGNQKAINLDARVLVGAFYPRLGESTPVPQPRFNLELVLQGPGSAPAYTLVRKILKQQKNWRLNGEFIVNPIDDGERFNLLLPDDYAIVEFSGEEAPDQVKMHFVAQSLPEDQGLHGAIQSRYTDISMSVVTEEELAEIFEAADLPIDHPLREWIDGATFEDAGRGRAQGVEQVNRRRRGRGMTAEELLKARDAAQKTGVEGEVLVNELLDDMRARLEVKDFEWTASSNAISPFDFRVIGAEERFVDVKTTVGAFAGPIHMSIGELEFAAREGCVYDVYRVFELGAGSPKLKVAKDIRQSLLPTIDALRSLPNGVKVDSISLSPDLLPFSDDVISLRAQDSGN